MPKPDKVLRLRPLDELQEAVAMLKRVVLFHPEQIVVERAPKMCVCRKDKRKRGKKTRERTQCVECWEWFHNDCANVPESAGGGGEDWKCEWCQSEMDKEGYQRWRSGRKKAKKRHARDRPRVNGAELGGDIACSFSAPPSWEGKVEEVRELSRRMAVKKRKLKEAVQELVDKEGHHMVDAEGMAGLELRAVDDGLVDEMVGAGMVDLDAISEE